MTVKETLAGLADKAEAKSTPAANAVRLIPSELTSFLFAGQRAYTNSITELSRMLLGFGRDVVDDSVNHVKATFRATNLRQVAELQVAFAQNRIEGAAAHLQQVVELARAKAGDAIDPLAGLVKTKEAA